MQVNALFVFLSPTFSVSYAFWCAVIFPCTELPAQWALLRVVCACAHAYELLGALMLLVCCRAIEVNRTFFFSFLTIIFMFAQFQLTAACVLALQLVLFFFFFLQTSSQVTQYNSNAKMSCLRWGVKKLAAIALACGRLENIVLFFDLCLYPREPHFNESSEREDFSSKVICNV